MAIVRKKFRELVFQMIFSKDFCHESDCKLLSSLFDQVMITKKTLKEAYMQMKKVLEKRTEIDQLIKKHVRDYDFKRISSVEKNILRLGIYELLFDDEIPSKVAIFEAVRLTRKFGTPEGGAFVNAILDAIYSTKMRSQLCLGNQI